MVLCVLNFKKQSLSYESNFVNNITKIMAVLNLHSPSSSVFSSVNRALAVKIT